MRRFVLGDLHGGFKALLQVLDRSGFDIQNDKLICLGDLCDGWPETQQCVEKLISIPNRVIILGNHDMWFRDYILTGNEPPIWTEQGGAATLESYQGVIPPSHKALFCDAKAWHSENNDVFVHGGLNPNINFMELQNIQVLLWDRDLIRTAYRDAMHYPDHPKNYGGWRRIFVGHTPVTKWKLTTPQQWGNVVAMDTGGGWEGKLSLMDLDSGEVFQSDNLRTLYPHAAGR